MSGKVFSGMLMLHYLKNKMSLSVALEKAPDLL